MRGSKRSANWSTSRPLLPCSHSLPSDDPACLLHSASVLQLILSRWNFGFYVAITAIRLYLSVAQSVALRLWAEGICQTRGPRSAKRPRSSILSVAPRGSRGRECINTQVCSIGVRTANMSTQQNGRHLLYTNKRMSSFSLLSS